MANHTEPSLPKEASPRNAWYCPDCQTPTEHSYTEKPKCLLCGHELGKTNKPQGSQVNLRRASRNQKSNNGQNFRGVTKFYYRFRCGALVYCQSQTIAGYCRMKKANCRFQTQRSLPGRPVAVALEKIE